MKSNYKQCALGSDVSSALIITAEQFSGASIIQQLLITFCPLSSHTQLTLWKPSFLSIMQKNDCHLSLKETIFFLFSATYPLQRISKDVCERLH